MLWFLVQYQSDQKNKRQVAIRLNNNVASALAFTALVNKNMDMALLYQSNSAQWKNMLMSKLNHWGMELLLRFGVNNNYVILNSPTVPNLMLYRQHLVNEYSMKTFNRKNHSEMIFGFTTGRCGFSRSQKRSFLAIEITMRAAVWFCKRLHKFVNGVKIRFLGSSRKILRHLHHFKRLGLGQKRVSIHSFIDVTPTPYNGVRQKMRGRKRYRYHKYTFKRFAKMYRRLQLARKTSFK